MSAREIGPQRTGDTPREQRLAAAGRVAAGLLHEFRNVLGPIGNMAFILERQADDPERVRELARRLTQLTQAQGRVTDRLRDFLRQDAARFPEDAIVDLSEVARDTVALCATLAASRPDAAPVRLTYEPGGALPVRGEGAELRTAVFELILNALEALPQGGTVRVRTRREGDLGLIEVQDDGTGLSSSAAEALLDPFATTKDDPGAGLGLPAAWGIAKRHGGELVIGPGTAGGTLVTLHLPLSLTTN